MDSIEFSKQIPSEQLAIIFKDFFEQHMLIYDILRDIQFVTISEVSFDKSSIIYSVKLLSEEDKGFVMTVLQNKNLSLTMYGKQYTPSVFMNGDLLCITINK